MAHADYKSLTPSELTPNKLEGATIYGPGEEKIGTVSRIRGVGSDIRVIIDVGGFLGIYAKPVAVLASQLDFVHHEDGDVHAVTSWTKDELRGMPEYVDDDLADLMKGPASTGLCS